MEAAPLVVDKTMYIVTPYPNTLYALDLTQPGAPMKWTYEPHPNPSSQGVAGCDVVNRGAAYYNGEIIYNLLDVEIVAVDAKTGKEVWRTKLGDINTGESITMAPIVAKGVVRVGNSGGEFGVRGWLCGLDAGILGALLTFTPRIWYSGYQTTTQDWGFTALEDQQLGGLIMWVPASIVYIVAGLALFAAWLRESDLLLERGTYGAK